MTWRASRDAEPGDLAKAHAGLRDLQHRLTVVQLQQTFLERAIDAKLIEISRLTHPKVQAELSRIAVRAGLR